MYVLCSSVVEDGLLFYTSKKKNVEKPNVELLDDGFGSPKRRLTRIRQVLRPIDF